MRRLSGAFIGAMLILGALAPSAAAADPRFGWDLTYSLSAPEFCGFPVTVHDYGWNLTTNESNGGWSWSKAWHGTRDYQADDATATMTWAWYTTQIQTGLTATTMELSITTHGSARVTGPSGGVVTRNAGTLTYDEHLLFDGTDWTWNGDDNFTAAGPHPMDFTNAFCDAMTALLQ